MKVIYILMAVLVASLVLFTACSPKVVNEPASGDDAYADLPEADADLAEDVEAGLVADDDDFVEIGDMI